MSLYTVYNKVHPIGFWYDHLVIECYPICMADNHEVGEVCMQQHCVWVNKDLNDFDNVNYHALLGFCCVHVCV